MHGSGKDIMQQVCSLEEIEPGAKWQRMHQNSISHFHYAFCLNRECKQNSFVTEDEVQQVLIY